jgi:hypothetical protein
MRFEHHQMTETAIDLRHQLLRPEPAALQLRLLPTKVREILVESFLVIKVVFFWMGMLPVAALFGLAIAILETLETFKTPKGPVGSSRTRYRGGNATVPRLNLTDIITTQK